MQKLRQNRYKLTNNVRKVLQITLQNADVKTSQAEFILQKWWGQPWFEDLSFCIQIYPSTQKMLNWHQHIYNVNSLCQLIVNHRSKMKVFITSTVNIKLTLIISIKLILHIDVYVNIQLDVNLMLPNLMYVTGNKYKEDHIFMHFFP